MRSRGQFSPYRWLFVAAIAAMLLVPLSGVAAGSPNPPGASTTVSLPEGANIVTLTLDGGQKDAYPGLDGQLSQLAAAYQKGDQAALAAFAGERHVDLAQGSARVILEMAVDPQAQAVGGPTYQQVALPGGRMATVEHAPRVAIRAELAAAIAATGATYETAYERWVQVLAPFDSLEALARLDGVAYVRLPFPAQQQELPAAPADAARPRPLVGAQTTEGVSLTNIGPWHTAGYNGSGIKLAVFDFGFTGWDSRQAAGDLPAGANLVLKDFSATYAFGPPGTAGEEHGTACAEIAYDMAPDATVYLYAFGTDVEFGQAAGDYTTNISGKRVATMSIGWVNAGPYDGTGPINAIVDSAQAAGILWANAAGNQQRSHHSWTSAQYSGGNSVAFGGGNVQGIGPASPSLWNILSGNTITLFLEWNDWNAARDGNQNRIDYDLYLMKWNGSIWDQVASSVGNQCNSANVPPTEAIGFTTTDNSNPYYAVYIQRYQGGGSCPNNFGHWMQLHTFNGFYTSGTGADYAFWYNNVCNSLTIPADGDSAMTVGATFWGEDGNAAYGYGLETFSSFGPRNASGGGNPGAAVNKPDVAAPDGVSTAAYGASNNQAYRIATSTGFWGTSAAAPHVAGMAASVWERNPAFSLSSLRSFIQGEALYKGTGGTCGGSMASAGAAPASGTQNNRFGWGRINLGLPQAVSLAGFEAQQQGDAVRVSWETVSELDNAGFNLYRSPAGDGERMLLAFVPSSAPGSTAGAAYTWQDAAGLVPGQTVYYWLEDVDVSGATTLHGPVSVEFSAPTAVTLGSVNAQGGAPALPPTVIVLVVLAALAAIAVAGQRRQVARG